jgi:hypothetical protein
MTVMSNEDPADPSVDERLVPTCGSPAQDLMLCANVACAWMGRCLAAEPLEAGEERDCQHGQHARACDRCADAREIAALRLDNQSLRTVMVAAAEEIHAHWDAHCDAEGYGPANLMRRLEEGIPAQYGYTAGRFAELVAELERLREALRWIDGATAATPGLTDVELGKAMSAIGTHARRALMPNARGNLPP